MPRREPPPCINQDHQKEQAGDSKIRVGRRSNEEYNDFIEIKISITYHREMPRKMKTSYE
jgi:hypothetical protein